MVINYKIWSQASVWTLELDMIHCCTRSPSLLPASDMQEHARIQVTLYVLRSFQPTPPPPLCHLTKFRALCSGPLSLSVPLWLSGCRVFQWYWLIVWVDARHSAKHVKPASRLTGWPTDRPTHPLARGPTSLAAAFSVARCQPKPDRPREGGAANPPESFCIMIHWHNHHQQHQNQH